MQLFQPGIQGEHLFAAEVAAFGHAQLQPRLMIVPGARQVARHLGPGADAAAPQFLQPRVGEGDRPFGIGRGPVVGMARQIPEHAQLGPRLDLHRRAQAIHLELFQQGVAGIRRHVQQQGAFALGDQEIEQDLALGRQQGGVQARARFQPRHVMGHQALQEGAGVRAGEGDDGAVVEMGWFHAESGKPRARLFQVKIAKGTVGGLTAGHETDF